MKGIERAPESASRQNYDLIVVGGGIYGLMVTLEAVLRGRSVLLLEKEDFGGATSYNSLRIIHGGLRELRTLNLRRYWRFGRERRWFLDRFPHLVERLPVLVPLYQRGLMRTEVFRLAFWADRMLLPHRHRKGERGRDIPHGQVVSPAEVKRRFPTVDEEDLEGGALWHDACVPDSQRLLMEILRSACEMGATALNYMPATELLEEEGQVVGVQARDTQTETSYRFQAEVVVNAAGPWSPEIARAFDRAQPELRGRLSAWNVLVDRAAPSDCAVGAAPPGPGSRHYFLLPWKGRMLLGTGHAPRTGVSADPDPTEEELTAFLEKLKAAFPTLDLSLQEVLHVYAGILPATQEGTAKQARQDRWVDHAEQGGPEGLVSVRGTKFTAARSTADRVLSRLFPEDERTTWESSRTHALQGGGSPPRGVFEPSAVLEADGTAQWAALTELIREEAVVHLDDLILRRTSLGDDPPKALRAAPRLCELFDWTEERCREEVRRVERQFPRAHPASVPDDSSRA